MRRLIPTPYTKLGLGDDIPAGHELVVMDTDKRVLVYQVVSVDTTKGEVVRFVDVVPENLEDWTTETVTGNFSIMRIADIETDTDRQKRKVLNG